MCRNVSSRGASGWGGIIGRCRRVGSGGRILTIGFWNFCLCKFLWSTCSMCRYLI
jgi:hypothetical protein